MKAWLLRWYMRWRSDRLLHDLLLLRQWRIRWWSWGLGSSRWSKLIDAIRSTAGASGRIVALITGAVSAEADSTDRRFVLVLAVLAGVGWWVLVHCVAFLLDRDRPQWPRR